MSIARALEIERRDEGERAVLTLRGELDIATVPRLTEAVDAALAQRPGMLIVDLRPMKFLDSSGLRQIIVLSDRARQEGWQLVLVRPEPPALSIFQITRADENLPFVDEPPA